MIQVSFIVAIYNVGKFLDKCIQSIITQELKDIEIILVNDGSTDNSLEICNLYKQRDSRIKVINQLNQGADTARNNGLRIAEGKWVYFVDGDDFVDARVCTGISEYMDKDYDVILFTNAVYSDGKIQSVRHSDMVMDLVQDDFTELQLSALNRIGKYKYEMNVLEPACIWNKLYNREFLNRNRIEFVPRFPKLQDVAFNLLVYDKAAKGVYVPNAGYYYRINHESVTHRYQSDIIDKFTVINRWFEEFVSGKNDPRFQKAYYERVTTHIRTCVVLYLCNRNNSDSYLERRKKFRELRMSEPYHTAVDSTSIFAFRGYKERILAFAVKYRLFGMCELLCRLNDFHK